MLQISLSDVTLIDALRCTALAATRALSVGQFPPLSLGACAIVFAKPDSRLRRLNDTAAADMRARCLYPLRLHSASQFSGSTPSRRANHNPVVGDLGDGTHAHMPVFVLEASPGKPEVPAACRRFESAAWG